MLLFTTFCTLLADLFELDCPRQLRERIDAPPLPRHMMAAS